MIKAMMAEILTQYQNHKSIVLECRTAVIKEKVLAELNALCEQNRIALKHHAPLQGTQIILPKETLLCLNLVCTTQPYQPGFLEAIVDVTQLKGHYFSTDMIMNPAEECLQLKQRVIQLEQENSQLKMRLDRLEAQVNTLLTPSAQIQHRYPFQLPPPNEATPYKHKKPKQASKTASEHHPFTFKKT